MSDTIDDVLDILHRTGDVMNGNFNHGPMVAETLHVLGRGNEAMPWVERYKTQLQDHPEAHHPISGQDWREALGERRRVGDWIVFFDRELAEAPWPEVLNRWVPRLAPGLMAAAGHGLIRTGHAVRSLGAAETPQRLYELAEGLGYWADRYQLLPGTPSGCDTRYSPQEALAHVQRIHGPDFDAGGSITRHLQGLSDEPSFAGAIDLTDTSGHLSQLISDLTETFAQVYLGNDRGLIAFVHSVTAPSALRNLLPYLSASSARLAARYAWQGCAAIYAWYSEALPIPTPELTPPSEQPEDLIDRAVAASGAHSIKFTEACLREYALNPKPIYLRAAYDVAERVGGF